MQSTQGKNACLLLSHPSSCPFLPSLLCWMSQHRRLAIFFFASVPPLTWVAFSFPLVFIVVGSAVCAAVVGLIGW